MEPREQYPDLEYKEQMQRELNARVAGTLVDNAARVSRAYQMATLSAVNGSWGAVWKDVEKGRITPSQAISIVDSLHNAKLINDFQAQYHKESATFWSIWQHQSYNNK